MIYVPFKLWKFHGDRTWSGTELKFGNPCYWYAAYKDVIAHTRTNIDIQVILRSMFSFRFVYFNCCLVSNFFSFVRSFSFFCYFDDLFQAGAFVLMWRFLLCVYLSRHIWKPFLIEMVFISGLSLVSIFHFPDSLNVHSKWAHLFNRKHLIDDFCDKLSRTSHFFCKYNSNSVTENNFTDLIVMFALLQWRVDLWFQYFFKDPPIFSRGVYLTVQLLQSSFFYFKFELEQRLKITISSRVWPGTRTCCYGPAWPDDDISKTNFTIIHWKRCQCFISNLP